MIAPLLTIAALAVAGAGALWDILRRRLPNVLCAVFAVVGAARLAVIEGPAALLLSTVHSVIALLVGMGLFALGWIGGGDAKFYAAAALGIPLAIAFKLLFWTSISGLLLLIVFIIGARLFPKATRERFFPRRELPYGVAIFVGYLLTVLEVNL